MHSDAPRVVPGVSKIRAAVMAGLGRVRGWVVHNPASRSWTARIGVGPRLLVIALVPMVALVSLSLPLITSAHSQMDASESAKTDVKNAAVLIELDADLATEESYSLADLILTNTSSTAVGPASDGPAAFSVPGQLLSAQRTTDDTLRLLPPSQARHVSSPLYSERAALASRQLTVQTQITLFTAASRATEATASTLLLHARDMILDIPSNRSAVLSILASNYALGAVQGATSQLRSLGTLWETPSTSASAAATPAPAIALAQAAAILATAGSSIASSEVPSVRAAWVKFATSPSYVAYSDLVALGEAGRSALVNPTPAQAATYAAILENALSSTTQYWTLLNGLSQSASAASIGAVGRLSNGAASSFWLWLILLVLAVSVALSLAVVIARTISRPLEQLASVALSVVRGSLDVEHLAPVGPRETVVVADAFNSLMANLRLLEAKSEALSRCDLDNELLDAPLPGRLGSALQGSFRALADSIRQRKELQDRLSFEATHDSLTGLMNRAAVVDSLERMIARSKTQGGAVAVLYMDLDNFKRANDFHGHRCGDHVLRQVGRRLLSATRGHDLVARIGGDEFVVVAEGVTTLREAEYVALRLISALCEPIEWQSLTLDIGACVGLALSGKDDIGALDLLAHADLALYQAKQQGAGSIGVFDEEVQARLAARDGVERDLRDELAGDASGLTLFYQPLVNTDMELYGLEALLRWQRIDHGPVSPTEFIPLAEASDLIIDIDNWVLENVARQVQAWRDDPLLGGLSVAVNVSGRHLRGHRLVDDLRAVMADTGVSATNITLEITETVLLADLEEVAAQLREVHDLGFRIAVDDFGTGYTSLAHLHHLPIDTIKIDRTFIAGVTTCEDASLVKLITDLAKSLGMTTVSEGVETVEQLNALREIGTDVVQGFLVARPMPPALLSFWCQGRLVASTPPRRAIPSRDSALASIQAGADPAEPADTRRELGATSAGDHRA